MSTLKFDNPDFPDFDMSKDLFVESDVRPPSSMMLNVGMMENIIINESYK